MKSSSAGRMLASLTCMIALATGGFWCQGAPPAGAPGVFPNLHQEGETTVIGSLVRADRGAIFIDAGAAGKVMAPIAPGTSIELSAPGSLDLIKKGAVVWVHGLVNWDDFYQLRNPTISLHLEAPRKETKIQLVMRGEMSELDSVVSFEPKLSEKNRRWKLGSECYLEIYGIVQSIDPLVIQCTSDTVALALIDPSKRKDGVVNIALPRPIHGARFTILAKDKQRIEVSLGTAWQLLGETPAVEARVFENSIGLRHDLKQPNGGAVSVNVWARRTAPITVDELRPVGNANRKVKAKVGKN